MIEGKSWTPKCKRLSKSMPYRVASKSDLRGDQYPAGRCKFT
jgi:hypothetical protein